MPTKIIYVFSVVITTGGGGVVMMVVFVYGHYYFMYTHMRLVQPASRPSRRKGFLLFSNLLCLHTRRQRYLSSALFVFENNTNNLYLFYCLFPAVIPSRGDFCEY